MPAPNHPLFIYYSLLHKSRHIGLHYKVLYTTSNIQFCLNTLFLYIWVLLILCVVMTMSEITSTDAVSFIAMDQPSSPSVGELSATSSDVIVQEFTYEYASPPAYTRFPTLFPTQMISLVPGRSSIGDHDTHSRTHIKRRLRAFKAATFTFTIWHVAITAIGQCPGIQTSSTAHIIYRGRLYELVLGCWTATIDSWAIFKCVSRHPDPHDIFHDKIGLLRIPCQYVIRGPTQNEPRRFYIGSDRLERWWRGVEPSFHFKAVLTFSPAYSIDLRMCHYLRHRPPVTFENDVWDYARELERVQCARCSPEEDDGEQPEVARGIARSTWCVHRLFSFMYPAIYP